MNSLSFNPSVVTPQFGAGQKRAGLLAAAALALPLATAVPARAIPIDGFNAQGWCQTNPQPCFADEVGQLREEIYQLATGADDVKHKEVVAHANRLTEAAKYMLPDTTEVQEVKTRLETLQKDLKRLKTERQRDFYKGAASLIVLEAVLAALGVAYMASKID